ncbi:hypothetical protein [Thermomonospora cellulosilytica]|uniref:Uncharacterized protein n=1 Tax=Thermomonospora cellulosilytica TaxID=1411118 RepID=A0A7W3R773_9ACTN|nr:hypothetical protein [Thermomonospora cellulosilytica]MBA9002025.1 hypothetical protein [Thermomonospora cellulosilytica]
MTTWTAEDAARLLDPPMTVDQVRALIKAAGIRPVGQRRTGRRGRPAETYDPAVLIRAHAALAPLLVETEHADNAQ